MRIMAYERKQMTPTNAELFIKLDSTIKTEEHRTVMGLRSGSRVAVETSSS